MHIRKANDSDIETLADVIRSSYATVAQSYNLTPDNCPKHPSNCTSDWLRKDVERGVIYYLIEKGSSILGCIAMEKANQETCYLERLAVMPEMRNRGLGHLLFGYFLNEAKSLGFNKIGIGIIAKQRELKEWYEKLGFVETGRKTFAHLPFEVAFMELNIA